MFKIPEMSKGRKYAGVLIKEQESKGYPKVLSPGATGVNPNLPAKLWRETGLLGAYKDDSSRMP